MSTEPIATEVLETLEAASALEPDWRALHMASTRATVFQSPEWVLGFLRHGAEGPPRIVLCRREGRLVGIVPFVAGPGGAWSLAGTGPSDVLELLAREEDAKAVATAALAHLGQRKDWRSLELQELREGSPLSKAAREGHAGEVAFDGAHSLAPFLSIPEGAERLAQIVPARWARRVERDTRACERAGLEVLVGRSPVEDVRAWAELHAARWRARGEAGALDGREPFFADVIPPLLEGGRAELLALSDRAGRIGASALFFLEERRVAYYLGGFDPAFAQRSPLVVLIGAAVERAARRGARELDFLRGAEAYKYRWGAIDRVQQRIRVHPRRA